MIFCIFFIFYFIIKCIFLCFPVFINTFVCFSIIILF
nr:MAG TPA: hypothetical protein [Bacteriophage sp.]